MALKTLVKVGSISNLSDCRYCAGMGVDLLGFQVVEGQNNFIDPKQFQEFRGWFTGPRVVAEAYGLTSDAALQALTERYAPDFVELSFNELKVISSPSEPFLLATNAKEFNDNKQLIRTFKDRIAYILLPANSSEQEVEAVSKDFPVMLSIENDTEIEAKLLWPLAGITLQGTHEEKPGLKNYDLLADVLEKLEVDG